MKPMITPAQMRDMEQRYFAETGTRSIVLMERAARALCDALLRRFGPNRRVYFACGPGGNGGDGYACARMYAWAGGRCALFPAAPPASPDAVKNRELALAAGIPELSPQGAPEAPDVWVDALYGTGLSRAPEGDAAALIDRMNRDRDRGAVVVAVDIPSGLNGLSGAAFSPCVRADMTVAFQLEKTGLRLGDGLDVCGEIEAADIGIPPEFLPDGLAALMEAADARRALPPKPRNAHKNMNGHLLIVAGSTGMAGAAAMCAQAALRSGVGLVTVACPESVLGIVQVLAPCAMALPLPEADGVLSMEAADALRPALAGKHAVACGCGLSRRAAPDALRLLMTCGIPAVFDADALNLIAADEGLKALLSPHHLITPHPGEAARLLGRAAADPITDAFALQGLGCQALLKGATTVIPVGRQARLSASGCPGMAKGGSGDVLTGLSGALTAQYAAAGAAMTGEALAECAAVASELHGLAGELAQARVGARGMCAADIVEALPRALSGDA